MSSYALYWLVICWSFVLLCRVCALLLAGSSRDLTKAAYTKAMKATTAIIFRRKRNQLAPPLDGCLYGFLLLAPWLLADLPGAATCG